MFHRHRVYNRREGLWIGWERKRGKLLDFNKLILGSYDSFPFKVGDLIRSFRRSATSSRSTPTRNCRADRRKN